MKLDAWSSTSSWEVALLSIIQRSVFSSYSELNEELVFGIQTGSGHGTLEVEAQPFLTVRKTLPVGQARERAPGRAREAQRASDPDTRSSPSRIA